MPAGDFPAGAGFAGFDPVYQPDQSAPFLPRAEAFDPRTKQFVLTDANGNYIDVHPVDQIVVVRASTMRGESKSAPDLGHRLAEVCARLPSSKVPQAAYAEVRRLYADLIANGDILLVSVVSDTSVRGRNLFAITYVNLRDPATSPRYPLLNSQTFKV